MSTFFKPDDGWAGDFIPFYWQGEYHLFYLKDYRDKDTYGEGMSWFHIKTHDFVTFTDLGQALPHGGQTDQDLYVFTGCVLEKDGQFHIFYTGHNPYFRAQGRAEQAIMHATSPDLVTWTKDCPNRILYADSERYEIHDWRDPFVFWIDEYQEYWMLLAARLPEGPSNRRGCTALAVSTDLAEWEVRPPFWAPYLYYTHECPDLFRMGDWWYLVFSTFSDRCVTHYRMSRDLRGPWLAPTNDTFDGRAFYAAKTASDGKRRFAFGWNPTRTDEKDTGVWNWGGNLVTHEVYQEAGGALSVKSPEEMTSHFDTPVQVTPNPEIGNWVISDRLLTAHAEGAFAWCRLGDMPFASHLGVSITFTAQTRDFGIVLRADDALEKYYLVRLEPSRDRVMFERWPRPGDEPPIIERPVTLTGNGPVRLQVFVEGSAIVIYINDQVAMSTRGHEHSGGTCGLFVSEGSATFADIQVCEVRS